MSGKVKISPPIVCAALGLVPLCVVRPLREWYGVLSVDRSRNEFRRGVKSTKFAIAGAKRKTEILSKLQICPHTIRNYALEISYGYGTMAAFRNTFRNSGTHPNLRLASPPWHTPASASRDSSSLGVPAAPPAATHLELRAPSTFRRPGFRAQAGAAPAGRRSGSGSRQGRVRWGWSFLSRPRGSVSSAGSVGSGLVARLYVCVRLWVGNSGSWYL